MPGEQLTCVVQLAYEKCGGSSLQRSTISDVFSSVNTYKCLCYTKKDLFKLGDVVKFCQLKEFILSKRDTKCTKREIQDRIELACWNQCKNVYTKCPIGQSEVFKLWQIFNRIADEESYPPVLTKPQATWILEKFSSITENTLKMSQYETGDLTFSHFLSYLQKKFDVGSLTSATKEIHEWLVKEIIKADWVYIRIKRRSNWSPWQKKWVDLTPGKLLLSNKKIDKQSSTASKIVFYIPEETRIQKTDIGVNCMTHIIHISHSPVFEFHFATLSENAMDLWLQGFNDSLKYCIENTSPIQLILKNHNDSKEAPKLCLKERENSFLKFKNEKVERKSAMIRGISVAEKKSYKQMSTSVKLFKHGEKKD